MFQYVLRRLLVAVPMLLGAMSIVFFAMRILPGDPCVAMMGDQATTEALADCTKNLGLHRPLAVQYVDYIWRSVQLDFGNSLRQGYPVSEYIARMFPHTLVLVLASAVVAALVGIPIGIVSALKRRSPLIDYPLRIFALLGPLHAGLLARDPAPHRVLAPPRRLPAHRGRRSRRRHRT